MSLDVVPRTLPGPPLRPRLGRRWVAPPPEIRNGSQEPGAGVRESGVGGRESEAGNPEPGTGIRSPGRAGRQTRCQRAGTTSGVQPGWAVCAWRQRKVEPPYVTVEPTA
ncbi:hypothetical protein E5Z02_11980 [Streptomyces rhizosphaericola]|uniref:Uncharacterized protein n=1 Tax=Streptomyces rhizosphaericola TaxID=2564098 RepID=A0ABY2PG55_9ACTN|nr:hypothetical protein E5Z02_11980 [Streptomyces rhizosphaericola]